MILLEPWSKLQHRTSLGGGDVIQSLVFLVHLPGLGRIGSYQGEGITSRIHSPEVKSNL